MNHAKKCQSIYEKKGQDGVFEYAGKHPGIPLRFCEPCEIDSPVFDGACLVCGTHNPEKTHIEQLFDNVNGGDCVDSAAELEEITQGLFDALKNLVDRNLIENVAGDHYGEVLAALAQAEGRE